MNLDGLRAFLAVVDAGDFVRASEALGVPRGTLRRRVAMLEGEVGRPLLTRTRKGATATEAGRVLADGARRLLLDVYALRGAVRGVGEEPSGVLRIGLPVGLPSQVMGVTWAAFRSAFPKVCLQARFFEDPRRRLLDEVDVAFHIDGNWSDGPWQVYAIGPVSERLMASPDYLSRRGRPISLADLADHDLLSLFMPGEATDSLPLLAGGTHPVVPAASGTDPRVLQEFAQAGMGIALCPIPPVPGVAHEGLEVVLPDIVGRERTIHMMVPRALVETPRLRAIFRFARSMLGREITSE